MDDVYDKIERFIEIMMNKNYRVVKVSDSDNANFCKYSIGKLSIMLFIILTQIPDLLMSFSKEISEISLTIANNENR